MNRSESTLPRILIIDDTFGRRLQSGANEERANLCRSLLLDDVTGDQDGGRSGSRIARPVAEAVFVRGQLPVVASVGDSVENHLSGCLEAVRSGWDNRAATVLPWALVLLDLCFYTGPVKTGGRSQLEGVPEGRPTDDDPSGYFGLEILRAIRESCPGLPVVILSGKPRPDSREIDAHGSLGFINAGAPDALATFKDYLARHGLIPDESGEIIGTSRELLLALREVRRLGMFSRNVLIRGESGTGKDLIAKYAHRLGRPKGPLVVVHSGNLNPTTYYSELFGHARGAFTDAKEQKEGLIVKADRGDLFFDEIGTAPDNVQAGLLRVLQDRIVRPMGSSDTRGIEVDVRFMFATNEDIEGRSLQGQFRPDLLERMRSDGTILLPSLRDRREDIPLLIDRFFRAAMAQRPSGVLKGVSEDGMKALCVNDWPGNIRALEGCVRKAVADYPDVEYLYPIHFQLPRHGAPKAPESAGVPQSQPVVATPGTSEALRLDDLLRLVEQFDFDRVTRGDLAGFLPKLQVAFYRFLGRTLEAALRQTSKPTPADPEGELVYTAALKLLKGTKKLTTTAAWDEIKRLFKTAESVSSVSPTLQKVIARAVEKRKTNPVAPRKQKADTSSI